MGVKGEGPGGLAQEDGLRRSIPVWGRVRRGVGEDLQGLRWLGWPKRGVWRAEAGGGQELLAPVVAEQSGAGGFLILQDPPPHSH